MNTHRTAFAALLVAVHALVPAGGCSPKTVAADGAADAAGAPPALAGTAWRCVSIRGVAVRAQHPPTVAFGSDGRASGLAGVNRYGGPYESRGQALHFGDCMLTRMAGPPELMDLERRYLDALRAVRSVAASGEALTMSDGGTPVLVFRRGTAE